MGRAGRKLGPWLPPTARSLKLGHMGVVVERCRNECEQMFDFGILTKGSIFVHFAEIFPKGLTLLKFRLYRPLSAGQL